MKQLSRVLGVTLLEIMLVLAVAAMVIVMSIRYYTSASNAQVTNNVMAQIQAVTAAMDNLKVGSGTYVGIGSGALAAVVGVSNIKTLWDAAQSITVTAPSVTGYTVTVPAAPAGVCFSVAAKLAAFPRYTSPACSAGAGATGNITYNYDSTKF